MSTPEQAPLIPTRLVQMHEVLAEGRQSLHDEAQEYDRTLVRFDAHLRQPPFNMTDVRNNGAAKISESYSLPINQGDDIDPATEPAHVVFARSGPLTNPYLTVYATNTEDKPVFFWQFGPAQDKVTLGQFDQNLNTLKRDHPEMARQKAALIEAAILLNRAARVGTAVPHEDHATAKALFLTISKPIKNGISRLANDAEPVFETQESQDKLTRLIAITAGDVFAKLVKSSELVDRVPVFTTGKTDSGEDALKDIVIKRRRTLLACILGTRVVETTRGRAVRSIVIKERTRTSNGSSRQHIDDINRYTVSRRQIRNALTWGGKNSHDKINEYQATINAAIKAKAYQEALAAEAPDWDANFAG